VRVVTNTRLQSQSNSWADVQARLKAAGIPTAVHYPIPLNKQPAVADATVQLPRGDEVAEQVISLPMHPYLSQSDQQTIAVLLVN
jgi:UDP-2-acetamido-2-deoxy-ribo-hexuluronate aminotransferase